MEIPPRPSSLAPTAYSTGDYQYQLSWDDYLHRYPSLYLIVSTTTSWASRPLPYQAAIDRCQQLNDGTATPQKGPELHATPANR